MDVTQVCGITGVKFGASILQTIMRVYPHEAEVHTMGQRNEATHTSPTIEDQAVSAHAAFKRVGTHRMACRTTTAFSSEVVSTEGTIWKPNCLYHLHGQRQQSAWGRRQ